MTTRHVIDLALLEQIRCHGDNLAVLLPYHLPERDDGGLEAALRGNVGLLRVDRLALNYAMMINKRGFLRNTRRRSWR